MLTGGEQRDREILDLLTPAAIADVPELAALDAVCFGATAWPRRAWAEVVADPGWTTLVARRDGRIDGALVLLLWPPHAALASIAVHPAHRAHGLGATMVREALFRARAAQARWLSLEVDADNLAAIRLYRREGFGLVRRFTEHGRSRFEMTHRLGGRHGS